MYCRRLVLSGPIRKGLRPRSRLRLPDRGLPADLIGTPQHRVAVVPLRSLHLQPRRYLIGQIGFVELLVLTRQESLPVHPDGQGEEDQRRKKKLFGAREKYQASPQRPFWRLIQLHFHSFSIGISFLIGSLRAGSAGQSSKSNVFLPCPACHSDPF